jgi:hypothetical protein
MAMEETIMNQNLDYKLELLAKAFRREVRLEMQVQDGRWFELDVFGTDVLYITLKGFQAQWDVATVLRCDLRIMEETI